MIDYTEDVRFGALHGAVLAIIQALHLEGIGDATSLTQRRAGLYNLQGHARAVIPLAVWVALRRPDLLPEIRQSTNLHVVMDNQADETRAPVWDQVKEATIELLGARGQDRVSVGDEEDSPETAADTARTYLSDSYGGGQDTGGGADTVLKRTLKLMAHTLPLAQE